MLSGGLLKWRRLVYLARLFRTSHHRLGRSLSDETPVTAKTRDTEHHATLKRGIASHTDILLRVYGGLLDKVPLGAAFGKGITMKMGQTNMHNYMKPLLERIVKGQIDPSYIISHRITLNEAPEMYKIWRDNRIDSG
jgi:hypothetical protein